MAFTAIDVETANADLASICAIGVARFENDQIVDAWKTTLDPNDCFDPFHVRKHGIDHTMVHGGKAFRDASKELSKWIENTVVVSHTHFDKTAIRQASVRWEVDLPACVWLDSAKVARRTWEECRWSRYGLADVCHLIGYEFKHHDALEDAKAAGQVIVSAMARKGVDIDGLLELVRQSIKGPLEETTKSSSRKGDPAGPFYGEAAVFTGTLSMRRHLAADLAASIGFKVTPSVTRTTSLVVVGDFDLRRLGGHDVSAKLRKALQMIQNGADIRIIRESDFRALVAEAAHK